MCVWVDCARPERGVQPAGGLPGAGGRLNGAPAELPGAGDQDSRRQPGLAPCLRHRP